MSQGAGTPLGCQADGEWVAIVDDHPSVRSGITRALRLEGIRAQSFASAEEYLECDMSTAPRCIVLDVQLPGMNGFELARAIEREHPPLPPVIFISGHVDTLASPEGRRIGRGHLRKPFEIDALLALVAQFVRAPV